MRSWFRKYWPITIIFLILIAVSVMFPFFLNAIYTAPTDKIKTAFWLIKYNPQDFRIGDILSYYGSFLALFGTVLLGCITLYHSHMSQEKSEQVDRLKLELERKLLALAEARYENETHTTDAPTPPKLVLRISGSNGRCSNLTLTLKNVSEAIISGIEVLQFSILDKTESLISSSNKVKISSNELSSMQETRIECNNSEIPQDNMPIKIEIKLKCEDQRSNFFYYQATYSTDSSQSIYGSNMKITQVG